MHVCLDRVFDIVINLLSCQSQIIKEAKELLPGGVNSPGMLLVWASCCCPPTSTAGTSTREL
jgi:hypothetical protein